MMRRFCLGILLVVLAFGAVSLITPRSTEAASAAEINRNVNKALVDLYAKTPSAKLLGEKAQGILVFPSITKGGFMVGGQFGEGALIQGRKDRGLLQHRSGFLRVAGRCPEIPGTRSFL